MFKEKQRRGFVEEEDQILEINLISAQGLKTPPGNLRRMQTYAIAWVDPSNKLRTRVDRLGAENPTWNDKFLFRVSPDFVASETSGVVVEIYAVGYIRDYLVGTVRFLLSSCLPPAASAGEIGAPAFNAVQIRRPSGRFHGVLNIAAAVSAWKNADLEIFHGSSAISFGDLTAGESVESEKENGRWKRRLSRIGSRDSELSSAAGSWDLDLSSLDLSDGAESTCTTASFSSSSPTASNGLKEWNGVSSRMAGALKELNSECTGGGILCGLLLQRRIPSNHSLRFSDESN